MPAKVTTPTGTPGREITKIILHCSDSTFGDASDIDSWHKQRKLDGEPWSMSQGGLYIGYHWVILNGRRNKSLFVAEDDGKLEAGRPEWEAGIHAKGHNEHSIAVCLISTDGKFTLPQVNKALFVVRSLLVKYSLSYNDVLTHNELSLKSCPGFSSGDFRALLTRH